jgi:hypothetical protein
MPVKEIHGTVEFGNTVGKLPMRCGNRGEKREGSEEYYDRNSKNGKSIGGH